MKKIALVLCCIVLAASLCVVASGCVTRNVVPGKMSELVGTYKLTQYTVTPDAEGEDTSSSEERAQDYIKLKGTEAYLVITGGDTGYYFFKDNETAWWSETVKLEYEYATDNDEKPTDLIRTVKFNNEVYSDSTFPGAGSETVGFNKKKHTLNYTQHSYNGKYIKIRNTTAVVYTRVSNDTTVAYAEKAIGKSIPRAKYELKKLNGLLHYDPSYTTSLPSDDLNPYIYCIIDFNNVTLDATLHYALKEDYLAGKRGDELKKTTAYKAELTEDANKVSLNFKFDDADGNPVFSMEKGFVTTMLRGESYYFVYNDETNRYVVTTADDENGIEAKDALNCYGKSNEISSYIDEALSRFAYENPDEDAE